jgi:hemoglobin
MKKDIRNRKDIEGLVNAFYEKVKADPIIGYIFTERIKMNWAMHLPIMYDFWENSLLYTGSYNGNPMDIHRKIHQLAHLEISHFEQWTKLFIATVDELYEGEKALLAKQRAFSISTVMQIKILEQKQPQNLL